MKIIINGAGGRMGKALTTLCEGHMRDSEIAALVDLNLTTDAAQKRYRTIWEVETPADCIIDFSSPRATRTLCKYATEKKIPLLIATTGQDAEEIAAMEAASKEIPLFHSANMSLGVALLISLAKKATMAMPDADIEIIETHHNRKVDAPSGTALMIAHAIEGVQSGLCEVFGRHGQSKRQKNEIGIHAIRMGNIVGEHEVRFGTDSETVTLKHTAHSRTLFAEGALAAAAYLMKKTHGMYCMDDLTK